MGFEVMKLLGPAVTDRRYSEQFAVERGDVFTADKDRDSKILATHRSGRELLVIRDDVEPHRGTGLESGEKLAHCREFPQCIERDRAHVLSRKPWDQLSFSKK